MQLEEAVLDLLCFHLLPLDSYPAVLGTCEGAKGP